MKLIKSPNPILQQRAEDWNFELDQSAEQVEAEMIQIMLENNGRGLAANQVGLLKRVFTIQLRGEQPIAMFNPTVINQSDELSIDEEGCLSFPDLWLDVKRPKRIDVVYLDKLGKECTMTLSGIDARCFLHELDHLNGVCFTDLVSVLKLAMAKKQQQKKRKRYG
ncbi:Def N-formylmethionyl-tRNA deformylase [uncultured Caudovirales phage]|uniref:Def N-formylmethionyl-tRNA deformylase n=1 Tax=uncultured Caudovirales phage TaxID=2100421 RepID=A0A6J5KX99_9CAUD|nr:Def N-formylmethionyl-tRNA deformylase [uncultured Caudovirales phage]CAB5208960.1 Def N-formylmethionyl-tRNA deformylase [uncultured Caudovirales phage]